MYSKSIGELLEFERNRKGITQEKVCEGLCNVSTYNRYERDEILPDKFILDCLLERMGRNPDTINYLMNVSEIYIRELRRDIVNELDNKENIDSLIKQYSKVNVHRHANLHRQFIKYAQGKYAEIDGKKENALRLYVDALKETRVDDWRNDGIYSRMELNLIFFISKLEHDYDTIFEMQKFLLRRENDDVLKRNLYGEVVLWLVRNIDIDAISKFKMIEQAIDYKKKIIQYNGIRELIDEKASLGIPLEKNEYLIKDIDKVLMEVQDLLNG